MLRQRNSMRRKEWQRWSYEEEGVAEMKCFITWSWPLFPILLCLPPAGRGGRIVGNNKSKVQPGKTGRWREGIFNISASYYPNLLLNGNKLYWSSASWICFGYDGNWWVISLSLSYCLIFLSHAATADMIRMGHSMRKHTRIYLNLSHQILHINQLFLDRYPL